MSVILALVVVGPGLAPGYVLRADMVFTPRLPFSAALLGLTSSTARSVPSDALIALLDRVLPGDLVQSLVLLGLVTGAGVGAATLAGGPVTRRIGAAVAYAWSPMMAERLLLGQWAVLIGYAGLPWTLVAARAVRRRQPQAWPLLLLAVAAAGAGGGPAWLIVALPVMSAVVPTPHRVTSTSSSWSVLGATVSSLLGAAALLLLVAVPWSVPSALRPGGVIADPAGPQVFAVRPDVPLGSWVAVLTGGGVWDSGSVPPGRDSWPGALAAVTVLGVGVAGILVSRRRMVVRRLALPAAIGVFIAAASLWTPTRDGLAALPGGGLFRDASRSVAPWWLLVSIGVGHAAERAGRRPARSPTRRGDVPAGHVIAGLMVLLPVAALPALGWGVSASLRPVHYPADYRRVSHLLAADGRPGAVLVLPFSAYRDYPWNPGRSVIDVAPRWISRPTVVDSDLVVATTAARDGRIVVAGEDRLAVAAGQALGRSIPSSRLPALGALGVRWILIDDASERTTPAEWLTANTTMVFRGSSLALVELPTSLVAVDRARLPYAGFAPPTVPVVVGDVTTAAVMFAGTGWLLWQASRRRVGSQHRTTDLPPC